MCWFDEIDLDPQAHPVTMGTRSLGNRPWLIVDDKRTAELAIKRDLLTNHRSAVLHATPQSHQAGRNVIDLIKLAGIDDPELRSNTGDQHPLERAALAVQEDLVLLDRRPNGWHLNSAALCFPTRWTLADKVDRHITAVHSPVPDYDTRISDRVDSLFDRLTTDRPVWRRNWFLMTDPTLFQPFPTTIAHLDPAQIEHGMWIRSERQTLRRLESGWVLFTIRIQQERLCDLLDTEERFDAFTRWVRDVHVHAEPRRHLTAAQQPPLLEALAHRTRLGGWPQG